MTPSMLESLKMQYPEGSVLYRRYILGERCIAEGLVFPFFDESCIREPPAGLKVRYAGIDFGTVHPTAMGWYGRDKETGVWYKVRDWMATTEDSTLAATWAEVSTPSAEAGSCPSVPPLPPAFGVTCWMTTVFFRLATSTPA